MEVFWLLVWKC